MKARFSWLWLLLFICIASPAQAKLKTGEPAPDFTAKTLEGKSVRFSTFNGNLRLVEMGTTWCPSCTEQAHQIDNLQDFLQKKKITTISVFLADPPDSIREHLKEEDLSAANHILIDTGEARRNYGIYTIPRVLFIDENGKVIFDEMLLNSSNLKNKITDFLNAN
ncbi:MAG: TlpA family protein disulfide reductase [Geopsychrobacter sp.]|nr:TlpA family protein disulfide reductase [Geopsychrobacter sp.]